MQISWLLALSYWIHLLATILWLGGIALLALVGVPALRRGTVTENQWYSFQRRFAPWANLSLILLLITGFFQMTNDTNYNGFLTIDSTWAWAMLLKHVAFGIMVLITAYVQFLLFPAMDRLALAAVKRPSLAEAEQLQLQQREIVLLRINLICAATVLLFTAVATAI
jgi:uncharacterized membrane protein